MYQADEFGRVWLDDETFIAPFGHFEADYKYIVDYLKNPVIAKRTFYDGLTFEELIHRYVQYLKYGVGWIGFHKKKRGGFVILEPVSLKPLIYAVHGGLDAHLSKHDIGQKMMDFIKWSVFTQANAYKLEGYICKPNQLIKRFFNKFGLVKESELQDRILIDGTPSPMYIYGLTKEVYLKEKNHGRITTEASTPAKSRGNGKGTSGSSGTRTRKNKSRKSRVRKRLSRKQRSKRGF
jgi:hypothetical protein